MQALVGFTNRLLIAKISQSSSRKMKHTSNHVPAICEDMTSDAKLVANGLESPYPVVEVGIDVPSDDNVGHWFESSGNAWRKVLFRNITTAVEVINFLVSLGKKRHCFCLMLEVVAAQVRRVPGNPETRFEPYRTSHTKPALSFDSTAGPNQKNRLSAQST